MSQPVNSIRQRAYIREALRLLPSAAAICVAVDMAALPALFLFPGLTPVSILLLALLVTPVWAVATAAATYVLDDVPIAIPDLLSRARVFRSTKYALIPALLLVMLALDWSVMTATRAWFFIPSVGLVGAASLLAVASALLLFPLQALTGARGAVLWRAALTMAARRPSVPISVLAIGGVAIVAALTWSVSLLFLVPGPMVLVALLGVKKYQREFEDATTNDLEAVSRSGSK